MSIKAYYIRVKESHEVRLLYKIDQDMMNHILLMRISNIVRCLENMSIDNTKIIIYDYDNKNYIIFDENMYESFIVAINLDFCTNYCGCTDGNRNAHQKSCVNAGSGMRLSSTPQIIKNIIKNIDMFPQDLTNIILNYFVTP